MRRAGREQALRMRQRVRIHRRVVVGGARSARIAEQARAVRAGDQNADLVLQRLRHDPLRRVLFEQGVAAGQHHAVQREQRHQFQRDVFLVDADADRAAGAAGLELGHRRQGLVQRLAQHRRVPFAMGEAADIVQQQHVHVVGAQPLQAGFEFAQHAVAAVVERGATPGHGEAVASRRGIGLVIDAAPNLGRQRVARTRQPAQALPEPAFAQPVAVIRCGVEMADAGGMGVGDRGQRHRVVHFRVQIADRRGTEAQRGDAHAAAAQRALRDRAGFGGGADGVQRHLPAFAPMAAAHGPRALRDRLLLGLRMARLRPRGLDRMMPARDAAIADAACQLFVYEYINHK